MCPVLVSTIDNHTIAISYEERLLLGLAVTYQGPRDDGTWTIAVIITGVPPRFKDMEPSTHIITNVT